MTKSISNSTQNERSDADPVIDALLSEFLPHSPDRRKLPPDLTASILKKLETPAGEEAVTIDDADPIIDALLTEFVPTEAAKRSSPPDLTASILQRLADAPHAESENVDDDPVIDALLPEFVPGDPRKRTAPPNLAGEIITQLSDSDQSIATPSPAATSTDVASDDAVSLPRLVSYVVAVAASIAGIVWFSGWGGNDDGIAVNSPPSEVIGDPGLVGPAIDQLGPEGPGVIASPRLVQSDPASTGEATDGDNANGIRGIPLESPSVAMNPDRDRLDGSAPGPDRILEADSTPIVEVAARSGQTARNYWQNLGITPTPAAPVNEVAVRLNGRLGIKLSEEALNDPRRLRDVLAQDSNANEIAKRLLALTSGNQLNAVTRDENAKLIDELANSVAGKERLDTTLVSLIDGSSSNSQRWYETLAREGSEGISKHLASLSFNADLRCVRCHDSHIGRSGTQDDYWSFVALVRSAVKRQDARWVVSEESKPEPAFFELLDGRQRMASPRVSGYLLQSDDQIKDFQSWTKTLAGSKALAGSMVDSLWKLVHGRPLKPSPVDAFAPPYDNSLDQLHELLAEDLRANEFDVARTLALIISSPMSNRSVPASLRDEALLTASDQQRSEALQLVSAFAASVQPPQSGMRQRIDVAMRRIGERLTKDPDAMLAQPLTENPFDPRRRGSGDLQRTISPSEQLSVDFPGDDASLPVSWLQSIDDFDRKVQHLAYLSGRGRVPQEITDAANRLKEAGSEASALSRIWWILRN